MSYYAGYATAWLNTPIEQRHVDADGAYQYQCVDLIEDYTHRGWGVALPINANAIDYASITRNDIMVEFAHFGGTPVEGDVVALRGLTGNPYGHIMLASGRLFNGQFEGLEQNGATGSGDGLGGNAIRLRYVDTSRIAGILRPRNIGGSMPVPTPQPTPVTTPVNTLYLPAVPLWKVYRENGPYVLGRQIGNLTPAKWNGLTYSIVRWAATNVAIIDTGAYGRVAIYVGPETGATIN